MTISTQVRGTRRRVYLAWVGFQRRPLSMAAELGAPIYFVPAARLPAALRILAYVGQFARTLTLLWAERPDELWVQLPPTFLPHIMLLYRLSAFKKVTLVADCHNGSLDPALYKGRWAKLPGLLRCLAHFDLILVHNAWMRELALARGLPSEKVFVLETKPASLRGSISLAEAATVLVPCSFRDDEPVMVLLDAARRLPDVTFILTGNRAKAEAAGYCASAPGNVEFVGFLPVTEYDALLCEAWVICGLTTGEGIQLSVANEAIGASKPLVLSDTETLKELFGAAALFAPNEGPDLASALENAIHDRVVLSRRSAALRDLRDQRWRTQFDEVTAGLPAHGV